MFDEIYWHDGGSRLWLIAVGCVLAGHVAVSIWRYVLRKRFRDMVLFERVLATTSVAMQHLRTALVAAGLVLIIAALAQPKYGTVGGRYTHKGIDIVIAMDISKSMLVQDVVPNRLKAAVHEVRKVLSKLKGGRVGLVPFAGVSFPQALLTSNMGVIENKLQDLNPADMPIPGTAVARAVVQATDMFTPPTRPAQRRKPRKHSEKAEPEMVVKALPGSKTKVILLVTDGEDHEGDLDQAAAYAKEKGVQVFAIGVGSSSGNFVPILDEKGRQVDVLKEKDQKTPVLSSLNLEALGRLAKATGGRKFHLQNQSIADDVFQALDELQKLEYEAEEQEQKEDRFQFALLPALLLLSLELVLTDRRRRRKTRWE